MSINIFFFFERKRGKGVRSFCSQTEFTDCYVYYDLFSWTDRNAGLYLYYKLHGNPMDWLYIQGGYHVVLHCIVKSHPCQR